MPGISLGLQAPRGQTHSSGIAISPVCLFTLVFLNIFKEFSISFSW
jgi:hypothetical protein